MRFFRLAGGRVGWSAAAVLLAPAVAELKRLSVLNGCDKEPLWVAHEAAADSGPDEQNIRIGPGEKFDFLTPDGLSATRYWAKMGCDERGDNCLLGGSGGPGQKCVLRPPVVPEDDYKNCAPPIDTKFEASFGKSGLPCDPELQTPDAMEGCDYVDASLVDGFTLPFKLEIKRNGGSGCDKDWVDVIDCRRLSYALCPGDELLTAAGMTVDLKAKNPKTGVVSGCYAPCQKLVDSKWNNSLAIGRHHSDPEVAPYCCPTPPETPEECRAGPIEKTQFLKAVHEACPGVYGYAYDDGMGLLRCDAKSTYEMTFYCPQHDLSDLPPLNVTSTTTTTTTLPGVPALDAVDAMEMPPKGYGGIHISNSNDLTKRPPLTGAAEGEADAHDAASAGTVGAEADALDVAEAEESIEEIQDCDAAISSWQEDWSPAKKEWCCSNSEVGCETVEEPFDCRSSYARRREKWDFNKKDWCCVYKQVNCDDEALVAKWVQQPRPLAVERRRQVSGLAALVCSMGLLTVMVAFARQQACRCVEWTRSQARSSPLCPPRALPGVAHERAQLDGEALEGGHAPSSGLCEGAFSPTESSSLLSHRPR